MTMEELKAKIKFGLDKVPEADVVAIVKTATDISASVASLLTGVPIKELSQELVLLGKWELHRYLYSPGSAHTRPRVKYEERTGVR